MTVFWVLYHQKAKKVYLYHSTTIMQTIYVGEHKTPTHAGTLTFSQKNVKRGFQNCSCLLLVYLRIYSYPCLVRVLWGGKTFSGPWCQMRKGVKLPIIFKFGFERIIPQTLYYPLSYFLSSSPFDVHLNVYIITGLREQSHHHSIIAVPSFAIRKFHYRCYILCGLENSLSRMSSLYKDEKRCNPGGKIYIRKDEYYHEM